MGVWDKGGNSGSGRDFKNVPPGRYVVAVTKWEDGRSKTDKPFVKVVMRVILPAAQKGDYIVSRFYTALNTLWKWDRLAVALGYSGEPFKLSASAPEMGAFLQRAVFAVKTSIRDRYVEVDEWEQATPDEQVRCREELAKARDNVAKGQRGDSSSGSGSSGGTGLDAPLTVPAQYADGGGEIESQVPPGDDDQIPF